MQAGKTLHNQFKALAKDCQDAGGGKIPGQFHPAHSLARRRNYATIALPITLPISNPEKG